MRPVQLADIEVAARVLCGVAANERHAEAEAICQRAKIADKFRKRMGRPHPELGSGTIMSAVRGYPQVARPDQLTPEYLDALIAICTQLRAVRCDQNL